MDACLTDIANTGPCICLLACVVPAASRVGVEAFGGSANGGIVRVAVCQLLARYRPLAVVVGFSGL